MTLNEFKAWLEGLEEAFTSTYHSGHPNLEQWKKIKDKLAMVKAEEPKRPAYRGQEVTLDPGPIKLTTRTAQASQPAAEE